METQNRKRFVLQTSLPSRRMIFQRREWFVAVFVVTFVNGVASQIHQWIHDGWSSSAGSATANWIVWASALAIVRLLWLGNRDAVSRSDGFVIGTLLLILMWPLPEISWVTLSVAGLYLAFSRPREEEIRSAGIVMLALSVPMLWGRLIPLFFGNALGALRRYSCSRFYRGARSWQCYEFRRKR